MVTEVNLVNVLGYHGKLIGNQVSMVTIEVTSAKLCLNLIMDMNL